MQSFFFLIGDTERIQGIGHGNQINGMKAEGDWLYTCGIDDSVKQVNVTTRSYTGVDTKLSSQPRGMDLKGNTIVVGSVNEVKSLTFL